MKVRFIVACLLLGLYCMPGFSAAAAAGAGAVQAPIEDMLKPRCALESVKLFFAPKSTKMKRMTSLLAEAIDEKEAAQVTHLLQGGANPNEVHKRVPMLQRVIKHWDSAKQELNPKNECLPDILKAMLYSGINLSRRVKANGQAQSLSDMILAENNKPLQCANGVPVWRRVILVDSLMARNKALNQNGCERFTESVYGRLMAMIPEKDKSKQLPFPIACLILQYGCYLDDHELQLLNSSSG